MRDVKRVAFFHPSSLIPSSADGCQDLRARHIMNAHSLALALCLRLEQVGRGDVDPGARVLHHQDREPRPAQVPSGVEATDINGDPADDHGGDAAAPQQAGEARMLRRYRVSFEVALKALPPKGM